MGEQPHGSLNEQQTTLGPNLPERQITKEVKGIGRESQCMLPLDTWLWMIEFGFSAAILIAILWARRGERKDHEEDIQSNQQLDNDIRELVGLLKATLQGETANPGKEEHDD